MENLLFYGAIAVVLWVIARKVFGGDSGIDKSMDLMLDVSRKYQMTQSQVEKAIESGSDIEHLLKEGFSLTENSTDRISLELKKENYHCEYNNYYELEGKKVKKVISELIGEWKVGKKTKSIKGGTTDAYQKWLDFDSDYEEALEAEEERLFEIEQDKLDEVGED